MDDVVKVAVPDILTMDGVVHLVDSFILPPRPPQQEEESLLGKIVSLLWHQDQSVEALVDRLEPYIDELETLG